MSNNWRLRWVPVDDLGALRVEELRRSCTHLVIDEPVLMRFHDSARKERQRHHDPHALANVDMLDVEAAVRGVIAAVEPHIVLTYEPHGGYYHQSVVNCSCGRIVRAGFVRSGIDGARRRAVLDGRCVFAGAVEPHGAAAVAAQLTVVPVIATRAEDPFRSRLPPIPKVVMISMNNRKWDRQLVDALKAAESREKERWRREREDW